MQDGLPEATPPRDLPSLKPWVVVAVILVLISLGIRVFWPVPTSQPLPRCAEHAEAQTACVK